MRDVVIVRISIDGLGLAILLGGIFLKQVGKIKPSSVIACTAIAFLLFGCVGLAEAKTVWMGWVCNPLFFVLALEASRLHEVEEESASY